MAVTLAGQSPIQLAIVIAFVWFAYRLTRSPHSLALWAVVSCLAFRYFASGGIADLRGQLGGVLSSASVAKVVMNAALAASWCSLLLFFLLAAAPHRAVRTAFREIAIMVAAVLTMAVMVAVTPNSDEAFSSGAGGALPSDVSISVVAFYIIGSAYIAYVTWRAAIWAWSYAAESTQRTRLGLRIAAVALGTMGSVAAIRAGQILLIWGGGTLPEWATLVNMGVPLGTLLFVLGVCLAGAAARIERFRIWLRHRRALRELRPLWSVLHDLFPEDRLVPAHEQSRLDRFSPRRVHQQFWRAVVEIRDGLVQLSPHLSDLGYDPDISLHQQSGLLREAIRRQRSGTAPSTRDAVLVAAPSSTGAFDVEADVEQLVLLSRSLS
ncbi:MAB_1171c family putative transporter [Actinopolyspora erythraea]|uniref:MAB_1171c family putative transporter n=1 Tax=Actinopolyspora erythraea TaxID=414996 RepID=UPI00118680AA|nr:MAB_1171c family putative transporter [Actinopolyspora erythraea]